jgi:hypothetical protein
MGYPDGFSFYAFEYATNACIFLIDPEEIVVQRVGLCEIIKRSTIVAQLEKDQSSHRVQRLVKILSHSMVIISGP